MAASPPFRPGRRVFTAGALVTAASLGMPMLGAQAKPEKPAVRISVGDRSSLYHLPLCIAERLDYFADAGLQVQIDDYGSAAAALHALLSGRADVSAGAYKHMLNLQTRKQFYTAFVVEGRAPQVVTAVALRQMPHYRRIEDLRGRRIGVSALGATTHLAAGLVLARGNLRPDDVTFVPVGLGEPAADALLSGRLDAIATFDPVITRLEQRGEVRVISDTRTLKDTQAIFGGPMPAGCLYAPEAFLQRKPQTTQALADAMVRALKWLQTASPGDLVKTLPGHYLQDDRALYLAAFEKVREALSPDGLVPEDGPATALRVASSFEPELAAAHIDVRRTFTNSFAQRAKQRFEA